MIAGTFSRFGIVVCAGTITILSASQSWAVDRTFSVTINPRHVAGTEVYDAAQVRVRLALNGSPVGSQLSVSGLATPISLDNSADIGGTTPYHVDFDSLTGNQVEIVIQSSNTDWSLSGLLPTSISFTYSNPASPARDISGYRASGFAPASSFQTGAEKCAGKLLGTSVVTMSAPHAGATPLARQPLDVILVLDESGSMSDVVVGSGGLTKMNLLHRAVNQFIDEWKADVDGVPGDRMGVVMFTTTATPLSFPSGFYIPRGAGDGSPHPWDQIKSLVGTREPQDMTNLGQGILDGIDRWRCNGTASCGAGGPRPPFGDLLILTNGLQNQSPLVEAALGSEARISTTRLPQQCGLQMQTVGIGAPGDVQSELLDRIAVQTGGKTEIVVPATLVDSAPPNPVAQAFRNALLNILKGNTADRIVTEVGRVASGQAADAPFSFSVNSTTRQVLLVADWLAPEFGLDLEIHRPDGTVATPVRNFSDPFHLVQTVDIPRSGPTGNWSVAVRKSRADLGQQIKYSLTVLAVDQDLSYALSFAKNVHKTGEPIVVRAELGAVSGPLLGLGSAIRASVRQPQAGFGSFMRGNEVSDQTLTTNPPGTNPDQFPNPATRKIYALLHENNFRVPFIPEPDPQPIVLLDNGDARNGDERANDGVYSALYSDTTVPGQYVFDVAIDASLHGGDRFQRSARLETNVLVGDADRDETEVLATRSGNDRYQLTIVPADNFGNFYGPQHEDEVRVDLTGGGTVQGQVTDRRADGTYTVALAGVPQSGAHLDVAVRGQTVADGDFPKDFEAPQKQWAVFGGIGGSVPFGTFNSDYDSNYAWQLGAEYRFLNRLSLEGVLGQDEFTGRSGRTNRSIVHLAPNAKYYGLLGTFQLAGFVGPELYYIEGTGAGFGLDAGLSAEYRLTSSWSLETVGTFHQVLAGSDDQYVTGIMQVRYRFE